LIVEHSVAIYGALVAALFAGFGIWLGLTLTKKKPAIIIKEIPAQSPDAGPFVVNQPRVDQFGITAPGRLRLRPVRLDHRPRRQPH
jgi:hypothetical protein